MQQILKFNVVIYILNICAILSALWIRQKIH